MFTTDGTHLSEAGYRVWVDYERNLINSILTDRQTVHDEKLNIYPNPSSDKIKLKGIPNISDFSCSVRSLDGTLILNYQKLSDNEIVIANLPSNVYILNMWNENNSESYTRLIQKK